LPSTSITSLAGGRDLGQVQVDLHRSPGERREVALLHHLRDGAGEGANGQERQHASLIVAIGGRGQAENGYRLCASRLLDGGQDALVDRVWDSVVRLVDEHRQDGRRVGGQEILCRLWGERLDGGDHDRGVQRAAALHQETHLQLFVPERLGQLQGEVLPMHQRQDAPLRLSELLGRKRGSNRTFAGASWQVDVQAPHSGLQASPEMIERQALIGAQVHDHMLAPPAQRDNIAAHINTA
jgi:hypothetical protein